MAVGVDDNADDVWGTMELLLVAANDARGRKRRRKKEINIALLRRAKQLGMLGQE